MSSTLYARGTLLQTGVRQRAERTEQTIRELFQLLEETRGELATLKKGNQQTCGSASCDGPIRELQKLMDATRADHAALKRENEELKRENEEIKRENEEFKKRLNHVYAVTGIPTYQRSESGSA